MQAPEREKDDRRDWIIIFGIILIGFLCILLASGWALLFSPGWLLNTNMDSNLDLDSEYRTQLPNLVFEPVDSSIATKPSWFNVFLTPGARFSTGTPYPTVADTSLPTRTASPVPPATNTGTASTPSPTRVVTLIPTKSSTPRATNTNGPTPTRTNTSVATATFTSTPSRTPTSTFTSTPSPTHTLTFTPSPTSTFTFTPTSTPTSSPIPSADLRIAKTDNASEYAPNTTKTYIIVVSNPFGPSSITGATVTDNFPAQIASSTWACTGAGGGDCTASGSGNISDTVNLPVGSSVTYTVNVTIGAVVSGDLVNTATVSLPGGFTDPVPDNNTSADTDTLIVVDTLPGSIGTNPDGNVYNLVSGGTLTLSTNITVNGHASWDLVYYEFPAGSGIWLDWVIVQVSDGQNWYTVFNWGDNVRDRNTNMDFNILPYPVMAPFPPPEEPDQRDIPSANLYNSTGIAIDLDGVVPPGTYSYIRFYAPPGDVDGKMEIDAIQILP